MTAATEGTHHSGSGSDPNLLKSLQRKKNVLEEQAQSKDSASLRWQLCFWQARISPKMAGEMDPKITYCKAAPGYPQTWCFYCLLKITFKKSISTLHMPEYHFRLIANCIRENTRGGRFKNICAHIYPYSQNCRSTNLSSHILASV